jgi:hypothetical protein
VRYNGPGELPATIPVFPLRGAILLPRASLPLNIFEPRYLAMVDDAIRTERLIGMIQPGRGASSDASPEGKAVDLRRVGGLGRVTSFQEIDDGRLMITLSGISRFEIIEELPSAKPYRICRISAERFAQDFARGRAEETVDRVNLLRVLKNYLEANSLKADWQSINRAGNEFLVNTLSVISPYGPEEKQALLEAADLRTRAEVLIALAEMELAGRDDGSGSTLQ